MAIKSCLSTERVEQENDQGWDVIQDNQNAPWSSSKKADDKIIINDDESDRTWLHVARRLRNPAVSGLFARTEVMIEMIRIGTKTTGERRFESLKGHRFAVLAKDVDQDGDYDNVRVQNKKGAIEFTMDNETIESDRNIYYTPACED